MINGKYFEGVKDLVEKYWGIKETLTFFFGFPIIHFIDTQNKVSSRRITILYSLV